MRNSFKSEYDMNCPLFTYGEEHQETPVCSDTSA